MYLATWEKPPLSSIGALQKGLEGKYSVKVVKVGEAPDFPSHSGVDRQLQDFPLRKFPVCIFIFLILSSKHISDNKKGQDGNEAKKTGQPQEASSSQALQHPGPGPNGHYPPQGRGGNLLPPSIAVTRPPGPRGYGVPGYPPGNPRFPGPQPGMPRGPPNYR